MRKSDKKMDNQLRIALTKVCDLALKDFVGFQWLTHLVNYNNFPQSLKVVCVFDTNQSLEDFMRKNSNLELNKLIQVNLFEIGISLKSMSDHIAYDTEEDCDKSHNGSWTRSLA